MQILMKRTPKMIFIASRAVRMLNKTIKTQYGYRVSKMVSLAEKNFLGF